MPDDPQRRASTVGASLPAYGLGVRLDDMARTVVERYARRERLPVDEEVDPGWNQAFVNAIRAFKEQFRGSPDLGPALAIASEDLYGRDIHWALELIQNAEDAGARRVTFVFERECVTVTNDGDPFIAEDVWGICSAGHSPKKNKIGFFGIGFKSVFMVTDAPEVRSGAYALRITEKIYPEPLSCEANPARGARFVLPIRPKDRHRLAAIASELTRPEFLHLLLTLTSLESIRIVDRLEKRRHGRFYRRVVAVDERARWDECVIGGSWPGCEDQTWRRYRIQSGPIPEGIQRRGRDLEPGASSVVVLARPVGQAVVPSKLHCFLPLDVPSELRWLVQADFDPTPGRERLRENQWNRWLLEEIGTAIAEAVASEARGGVAPWDLVPLPDEATSALQRIACDAALEGLRDRRFVRTAAGWRAPSTATWSIDTDLSHVIREADLAVATTRDTSYLRPSLLEPRAISVLSALDGRPVVVGDLMRLIAQTDAVFYGEARPGSWWLRALDVVARLGSSNQKTELASLRSIPLEGGGRVRPSPRVDTSGYLVAYSRSATLADLHSYFTSSEILLVDKFLEPKPDPPRRSSRPEDDAARLRVRDLLITDEFRVAPEAGPFHVVMNLVIPRMTALAELDRLDDGQRDQLRRMVEFVRHRWRGYVSDYRRWRSARADEDQIALQLGLGLKVAARIGTGRQARIVAWPLARSYLSTTLNPQARMSAALAGNPNAAIVDDVHAAPLPVPRVRGVRRAVRAQMAPGEFLQYLGAPIGPIVNTDGADRGGVRNVTRESAPWVMWPPEAFGRPHGLLGDSESDDVDWLVTQWEGWSNRQRTIRAKALWSSVAADWGRLAETAQARPFYFYYQWNGAGPPVASSWVGRLATIAWLPNAQLDLRAPGELILNTQVNRLATLDDAGALLATHVGPPEVATALGVRARPTTETVIRTLQDLRERSDVLDGRLIRRATTACYETLAAEVQAVSGSNRDALMATLRPKFTGNGRIGLIYAPPLLETRGRSWWPPARTVLTDVANDAGPYLGQLGARHRSAGLLWESLGVAKDLTPDIVAELIRLELSRDEPTDTATYFYGQLVRRLEREARLPPRPADLPALTTDGWVEPHRAWWTKRHEFRQAFGSRLSWWSPGAYDPSLLPAAGAWLGIGELTADNVSESWTETAPGDFPEPIARRWMAAITAWPAVLRAEGAAADLDVDLAGSVSQLRLVRTLAIEGELSFAPPFDDPIGVAARPACILRIDDGLFVATSEDSAFSRDAADVLSGLVGHERLRAANTLYALLTESRTSPEGFVRKYAALVPSLARVELTDWEEGEAEDANERWTEAFRRIRQTDADSEVGPRGTTPAERPQPDRKVEDPALFEMGAIEDISTGPQSKAVAEPRKDSHVPPEREKHSHERGSRETKPIPSNTTIEDAARPYVERFEMRRGGHRIDRQPALVGADYIADDGRYIEVKATGGAADDAFDLQESEWSAALDPRIRDAYWVYIVEHLTDGQEPIVTAIFNPVRDDNLGQAPVGKMRVTGWRMARRRSRVQFRRIGVTASNQRTPS